MIEAFLVSTVAVAIGEIGDKTQLLALMLAVRFRKPWTISFAILTATLVNHALAGFVGSWVAAHLDPSWLRWGVGLSFLAIALWTLKPDTLDDEPSTKSHAGVFVMTIVAFFLAEMGDKTQLATVALAARFHDLVPVVAGTTLGMLIADVPVVFLAERFALRIPLKTVRIVAALLFAVLGIVTLVL
jgi:putative Ca2+/H+ antiporter (TMEM165/GDT1 family)